MCISRATKPANAHQILEIFEWLYCITKLGRWQRSGIDTMTQDTIWESDKTQANITYKRAKRSALSQQVTTMLQETDKTVSQRQTQNTNNKNDQQQKHTFSKYKHYWRA